MKERWVDVPDWIGFYQVSDHGRVKSLARITVYERRTRWGDWHTHTKEVPECILASGIGTSGYVIAVLKNRSTKKTVMVHRLVAAAFIPNSEGKPQVNHKDLDKTNNFYLNLEWTTQHENMQHAARNGRCPGSGIRGSAHSRTSLTEEQVRQIRLLRASGVSRNALVTKFKINFSALDHIIARRSWKHVT